MLKLGIISTGRADYGLYLAVLRALAGSRRVSAGLFLTGTHLDPQLGPTVARQGTDGAPVWDEVPCLMSADTAEGVALSMAQAVAGFAHVYRRHPLDMLLLLGDRFEMFAAAAAAVPFGLPLAHIHGGEETEGAYDNGFRHAISKLSHLHFVATPLAARRLRQMGEHPDRVFTVGAPCLDLLNTTQVPERGAFLASVGLEDAPFLLVTFHPETLRGEAALQDFEIFAAAILTSGRSALVTLANADNTGRRINARWREIAAGSSKLRMVDTLGSELYFSAMAHAAAMVGNSSSGIIEAASLKCPVVNVGARQRGREQSGNVIDVPVDQAAIEAAIETAASPAFRAGLSDIINVYGDGHAGRRIAERLEAVSNPGELLVKRFDLWEWEPRNRAVSPSGRCRVGEYAV